ncbi:MAG TPA: GTPase Era, partial [Chitinophagaceae bacterium]|nr:GTPase Era [Chitinophagaceae bacterium]
NAGKSTLMNVLLGEKLSIVSQKVQTTRHRIKGFLTKPGEYQIIFSDTPGIIETKYKLHEKMMQHVKTALEDADVALLLADANESPEESHAIFSALKLKVPCIVVLNKIDKSPTNKIAAAEEFFSKQSYCNKLVKISAAQQLNLDELLNGVLELLPKAEPFFPEDDLTDLPQKFFVSEMVREKIYDLFGDEIPYHAAVIINEFKEKESLVKIQADIIVQRESQKAIIIGEGGKMIKKLGTLSRESIEKFLQQKVFLQLFVKVKPKWRDNEMQLKEYGY